MVEKEEGGVKDSWDVESGDEVLVKVVFVGKDKVDEDVDFDFEEDSDEDFDFDDDFLFEDEEKSVVVCLVVQCC